MSSLIIISTKVRDPKTGRWRHEEDWLKVLRSPDLWTRYDDVDGKLARIMDHFDGEFPAGTRIYYEIIANDHDVTPFDRDSLERLNRLEGNFFVVEAAAGGTDPISWVIAAVILVVAVVAAFLFKPKVPSVASKTGQQSSNAASPNNELSSRSNEARPLERIPDIVGQVRSTFDLIASPLTQFIDHQEIEVALMVIGEGSYHIDEAPRDGETPISDIDGATVQIYRPYAHVNSDEPYYRIGPPIDEAMVRARRSNSVNGQVLDPPNALTSKGIMTYAYPNTITGTADYDNDLKTGDELQVEAALREQATYSPSIKPYDTTSFVMLYESEDQVARYQTGYTINMSRAFFVINNESGNTVYDLSGTYVIAGAAKETIEDIDYCRVYLQNPMAVNRTWYRVPTDGNFSWTATPHTVTGAVIMDLGGTYTILSVNKQVITLQDPVSVNSTWSDLESYSAGVQISSILQSTGERWIGWYNLYQESRTHIYCNLVALNGLYADSGQNVSAVNVTVEVQAQAIDANNDPVGDIESYQYVVEGSRLKKTRALTAKVETSFTGPCRTRVRRVSKSPVLSQGQVVDELKWRDLYAVSPLSKDEFGNVTVVRSRTYATDGALAVKERKLSGLVTREIPLRVSDSTFTTDLHPTRDAAEILSFVALKENIGNMCKEEVDFDNIYNTIAEIKQYFGTPLAAEFCYTLDEKNISAEETIAMIADAVFSEAYRRGRVLRLSFEKQTDQPAMLFCHRNKIPGTETRTFTFGTQDDHDGIEYEYVSPDDDAIITKYIPHDRSAVKPQKHESVGVRNKVQAHFHASRLYNRLMNQHTAVEQEVTEEGHLLLRGYRVLIADNTRPDTQDGQVTGQDGLIMRCSQPVEMETGVHYYVSLQLMDQTVEQMKVFPGPDTRSVILERAPRHPLITDAQTDRSLKTLYTIVREDKLDADAFIVTELDWQDNMTVRMEGINYSDAYYTSDKDFINGKTISET